MIDNFPELSPTEILFPSADHAILFRTFFPKSKFVIGISVSLFKSQRSKRPFAPQEANKEAFVGCHLVS